MPERERERGERAANMNRCERERKTEKQEMSMQRCRAAGRLGT